MDNEILINREEIKGSYEDARKDLAEVLDITEIELNEILKVLGEYDKKLMKDNELSDEKKRGILEAIWKYKILCNKNDAENRTANTLNLFIKDIYKDSLHFFLELIQNADDASKGGSEHSLKITLDKESNIIFEYDERGFNFSDLFAITSVGNSSKKAKVEDRDTSIGEKGIGFKSIFAIAKEIKVKSKYFSFEILADPNDLISILEPSKVGIENGKNSNTKLTLVLKDDLKEKKEFLEQINEWLKDNILCEDFANPFIFLKNIKKISYVNEKNGEEEITINIQKEKINDKFALAKIDKKKYIIYTENMEFGKEAILSRWKYLEGELGEIDTIKRSTQIAFPLIEDEIECGKIYSYLPTTIEVKFPVFINLDVHLTASRGNITVNDFEKDSKWNEQVKNNLAQFLLNSYKAVIETHMSELKDNNELKQLREQLYKYIPTKEEVEKEFYSNELNDFYNKIQNEEVILSNKNSFFKMKDIYFVSVESNNNDKICQTEYEENKYERIYEFINLAGTEFNIPKNTEWNKLIYDLKKNSEQLKCNVYDFVKEQGGIKKYWEETEDKNTLEIIISLLDSNKIKGDNEHNFIEIIPCECIKDSNGFKLVSYSYIIDEMNKEVFIHSKKREIEDKENSIYIYEGENKIEGLKEKVEDIYGVSEYNLQKYFNKLSDELIECGIDESTMKDFIGRTFKFYERDATCYESKSCPKEIKEFFNKYTLSLKGWESYKDKDINIEYIRKVISLDTLKYWEIPNGIENRDKYIKYLLFLGLKHKIEFKDGKIDKISFEILQLEEKKFIEINNETRVVENESEIKRYFLEDINSLLDDQKIEKEHLVELCRLLGLFKIVKEKEKEIFVLENKEIFVLENSYIEKLNNKIKNYQNQKQNIYELKDCKFCIVSNKKYSNIWGNIESKNNKIKNTTMFESENKEIEIEFMNSFLNQGKEFISALRMSRILNECFGKSYAWGVNDNDKAFDLTLEKFLSCYKYLTGDENLGKLMKKGYIVLKDGMRNVSEFFKEFEDLQDFLNNTITDKKEIDLNQFAIVKSKNMKEEIIKFDEKNNKTEEIKYLLKFQENKSAMIVKALEVEYGKLETYQKKEIQNYFNELEEKAKNPKELNESGHPKYCEGVFFKFHEENIKKGEGELKSIWDKEILKQLCEKFELTDSSLMEGYGYNCPVCGERHLTALSGMEFNRFKTDSEETPYIYLVSCLNCAAMFRYAKKREIINFENIMKEFETCYCIDSNHIKSNLKMKTVNVELELYDNKEIVIPMKVSYLNMILYKKLDKKK